MQEVFEKIIEKIKEQVSIEENIAKSKTEGHPITHQYAANCMKEIEKHIKQAEAEYNNGWTPIGQYPTEPCILCFENGEMVVGYYEENGDLAVQTSSEYFTYIEEEPIAWMPLPEPYKGE